nr:MAG TPA: hypothetical protein [Caudoviricetes sp.]
MGTFRGCFSSRIICLQISRSSIFTHRKCGSR